MIQAMVRGQHRSATLTGKGQNLLFKPLHSRLIQRGERLIQNPDRLIDLQTQAGQGDSALLPCRHLTTGHVLIASQTNRRQRIPDGIAFDRLIQSAQPGQILLSTQGGLDGSGMT